MARRPFYSYIGSMSKDPTSQKQNLGNDDLPNRSVTIVGASARKLSAAALQAGTYGVVVRALSFAVDMVLILSVLLVTLATILFFTLITPLVMLFSLLIKKSPDHTGWKAAEAG